MLGLTDQSVPSEDVPDITLDGIDRFIGRFPTAPKLEERIEKQREISRNILNSDGEAWGGVNSGIYSRFYSPPDVFKGGESVYLAIIKNLLEKKETSTKPVVVVDLGGMFSYSFLKIAKLLERFILDGRLVIVSTSLNFNPGGTALRQKMANYPAAFFEFFYANKHLIHYVQSNAFNLGEVSVDTPKNGSLRLGDGVDFLFEKWSISLNSSLIDLEYPAVGECLDRDTGMMVLEGCATSMNNSAAIQGFRNLETIGVRTLGTFGQSGDVLCAPDSHRDLSSLGPLLKKSIDSTTWSYWG